MYLLNFVMWAVFFVLSYLFCARLMTRICAALERHT